MSALRFSSIVNVTLLSMADPEVSDLDLMTSSPTMTPYPDPVMAPAKTVAGLSVETFSYIFLAIGGAAPVLFLITVAVVMRCQRHRKLRRLKRHHARQLATRSLWEFERQQYLKSRAAVAVPVDQPDTAMNRATKPVKQSKQGVAAENGSSNTASKFTNGKVPVNNVTEAPGAVQKNGGNPHANGQTAQNTTGEFDTTERGVAPRLLPPNAIVMSNSNPDVYFKEHLVVALDDINFTYGLEPMENQAGASLSLTKRLTSPSRVKSPSRTQSLPSHVHKKPGFKSSAASQGVGEDPVVSPQPNGPNADQTDSSAKTKRSSSPRKQASINSEEALVLQSFERIYQDFDFDTTSISGATYSSFEQSRAAGASRGVSSSHSMLSRHPALSKNTNSGLGPKRISLGLPQHHPSEFQYVPVTSPAPIRNVKEKTPPPDEVISTRQDPAIHREPVTHAAPSSESGSNTDSSVSPIHVKVDLHPEPKYFHYALVPVDNAKSPHGNASTQTDPKMVQSKDIKRCYIRQPNIPFSHLHRYKHTATQVVISEEEGHAQYTSQTDSSSPSSGSLFGMSYRSTSIGQPPTTQSVPPSPSRAPFSKRPSSLRVQGSVSVSTQPAMTDRNKEHDAAPFYSDDSCHGFEEQGPELSRVAPLNAHADVIASSHKRPPKKSSKSAAMARAAGNVQRILHNRTPGAKSNRDQRENQPNPAGPALPDSRLSIAGWTTGEGDHGDIGHVFSNAVSDWSNVGKQEYIGYSNEAYLKQDTPESEYPAVEITRL